MARGIHLYDIVSVQHADYRHYGEVLSKRTPTDTFMVRMVPGHPGTLREIHAKHLTVSPINIRWVHYAQIEGPYRDGRKPHPGSFPVDMLRYDYCAPLNFDPETMTIDPTFGFDKMVVAKATLLKDPHWTTARWRSFMWSIAPIRTESIRHAKA